MIYTSVYRAAPDAVFSFARDHWATEEHIRASGLRWTFLRDCLYLDLVPMIGGPDGVILRTVSSGDRRAPAGSPESRSTTSPGWPGPFSSPRRSTRVRHTT